MPLEKEEEREQPKKMMEKSCEESFHSVKMLSEKEE